MGKNNQIIFFLSGFFIFLALSLMLFFVFKTDYRFQAEKCVIKTEERIVRGDSLTGLIESGERVKILLGYYSCNEVEREDIIIYYYAGSLNPLIKIVKGLAGDNFKIKEDERGRLISVNGQILKNSRNEPYILDEKGYKMISLYVKGYGGIIPEDAYLIMSNLTTGCVDSTRFGLIGRKNILGKVLPATGS